MKLFGYWRSSATYRVRIALNIKDIPYEYEAIDLLDGAQREAAHLARNPMALVPALETDDRANIVQSLAIIEYLEETHPSPSLLPKSPVARAAARAIAQTLASEAQPLMNLRIQQYLKNEGGFDKGKLNAWLAKWPGGAMAAMEEMVGAYGGDFCVGDTPTIADCCLVPQFYAANRFGIDVSSLPRLQAIVDRCSTLPAFEKAHPDNQPDAPGK
ncbi:MAG: maleylacetoacetate isomerase [Pseudomonadota bacterium]